MGLIDLFRKTPTPDGFARLFQQELKRHKPEVSVTYLPDDFQLRLDDAGVINLHNIYREYENAPPGERRQLLENFVRSMTEERDAPATFVEALPQLFPAVRSRALITYLELTSKLAPDQQIDIAYRELGADAILLLVIDSERSITMVTTEQLDSWKVQFDDAMALALDNLRSVSIDNFVADSRGTSVMRGAWDDSYDCSRILLPDLLHRGLQGRAPVMMVPARGSLLIAPRNSADAQLELVNLALEEFTQASRKCSAMMYQLDDGQLQIYEPDDERVRQVLGRLQRLSLGQDYADQKELLEKLHEMHGEDVFVAPYLLYETDGKVTSLCVWTAGVLTLLPKTDVIAMLTSDDAKAHEMAWEDVHGQFPELFEPFPGYPPRYQVTAFPHSLFPTVGNASESASGQ